MALFLSTFVNKIDRKGRISVPASFRAAVAGQSFHGIVLYRSHQHPTLEGSGIGRMEQLAGEVDSLDRFSEAQDDFASAIFPDVRQLAFDGEGRIILAEDLREHAGITGEAAFVGRGPVFQIWQPERFTAFQQAARERLRTAGRTLRPAAADAPRSPAPDGDGS
ncbi:MAG: division/cell wall cluster transcriptional repressor MraZ [Alphaproteobacteria bacterium]